MLRICGSTARSFGRKSRVGQLSMIADATALVSISASDWVANTTEAFFLRSVLSHSRSCAPKQIAEHGGRGTGADEPFGLERLHVGAAEMLVLGIEQPAVGAAETI